MSKVDDELSRRFHRAQRPVEEDALIERLRHRRTRRQTLRKVQAGAVAVAVLAATATGFVALSRSFSGDDHVPGLSPVPIVPKSNGLIAYTDGSSVYTIAPDGEGPSRIDGLPGETWHVAWSPDGSRLALSVFPGRGPRQLWVANVDGTDATVLAEADNVSEPSWSPDGSSIAYAADEDGGSSIHVIAADGSNDRIVGEVSRGPDYFSAVFSPDGTEILFDKGTDTGFAIFVMRADGTDVRRLTEGTNDYDPAWSPDGKSIAFTRQEDSMESDIFVMRADGSDVWRLTDEPFASTNLGPVWAPDGSLIAYQSGRSGGPGGLVVMKPDGSDPRTLVDDGVLGLDWQPLPTTPSNIASAEPPPVADGLDVGLGFNLCHAQATTAELIGDDRPDTIWTGTRARRAEMCPDVPARDAEWYLAVDVAGNDSADHQTGPLECDGRCSVIATPDIDGDGAQEIVVGFFVYVPTAPGRGWVYDVRVGETGAKLVRIDQPGGTPLVVTWGAGGAGTWQAGSRCPEPGLVEVWNATSPDAGSTWEVESTTYRLEEDGGRLVATLEARSTGSEPPDPRFLCGEDAPIGG